MNDFDDKWIKDIRNRMENYSEPLPADLWEKIESEISVPKIVPMWRRWYSVAAAVAAVSLVSVITVSTWNNHIDDGTERMAHEILPKAKSDAVLPISAELVVAAVEKHETKAVSGISTNAHPVVPVAKDTVTEYIETKTEEPYKAEEDVETKETAAKMRINMMKADRETQKRNASYMAVADGSKSRNRNLQIGFAAGNTPYNSSNSFLGMSRLSARNIIKQVNDAVISESSGEAVSYSQILFNNIDKQTYTDVKHHMPVTVGASVKWNINKHWGLETGLSYTYLFSELKSGATSYVEDKQKLHYVGIPLKVHRSILGNERFSLYASAGGMVEKCISGSVETICVDGTKRQSVDTESVASKPWQLSINASLGAQVNLLKFMSLYLEPGMSYYFDDGSDILTIRKDKPFNFNLQFGLRFNVGR